jgi:hypothetical protein
MSNVFYRRHIEGWRVWVVMSATMVAGFWSLMSGTVAVALLLALGL